MKDFKFFPKMLWAFLAAFLSAMFTLDIMKHTPIAIINPQRGEAATLLFVLFIWLCFAIYTLKVLTYELVYTAKKAIKDAERSDA